MAGLWTVPDIQKGVAYARKLHARGGGAILNILGEHHETVDLVNRDFRKYVDLIDAMGREKTRGLNAAISIKPTQFGFDLKNFSEDERKRITKNNMWTIVFYAARKGIPIEFDMEHSGTHDFTISLFKAFSQKLNEMGKGGMLGMALQANYERTQDDLKHLLSLDSKTYGKLKIRLVKGVYTAPKDPLAKPGSWALENYKRLMRTVADVPTTHRVVLGTHREDMILLQKELGLSEKEIQVLKGIRGLFAKGLSKRGYSVWAYVPIGSRNEAAAYASRRLKKGMKLLGATARDWLWRPFELSSGKWLDKKRSAGS